MLRIELKPLFARLNPICTMALEQAAGLTLSRHHYEITIEHFLLGLLEQDQTDIELIFKDHDLSISVFRHALEQQLQLFSIGNSGRPVFSPLLTDWVQEAWLVSSLQLGQAQIRSGALLITLLSRADYYMMRSEWGRLLHNISSDLVLQQADQWLSQSKEVVPTEAASSANGVTAKQGSAIEKYCEDFCAKARAGKIDPIIGRDHEIRQMIDILGRRRKNNPICVGEPGVGKTAVVEGLALRIVEGDVPDFLLNTRLVGLDLGLLEAGASVKGEFEKRLKAVIDEIQAAPEPMILFIDEAHMLIGAGGTAGGTDAANLLKPALARGELRTIAATTWAEYKKYFERDPALARRFQLVKLNTPDVATAIQILRGVKEQYERDHGVFVRDDAIVAAAELSDRYIIGRMLPDKAVDLLDTAAARIKINLNTEPAQLERLARQREALLKEQKALERDQAHGHAVATERVPALLVKQQEIQAQYENIKASWLKQKEVAQALLALRQQDQLEPEQVQHMESLKAQLDALHKEETFVFTEVTPDALAHVVADWTGVPLGKMQRDSVAQILDLEQRLQHRIQGQAMALTQIASTLKAAQAGLRDPAQPLGVFLLVGPSGVGKTETALAIADELFGGEAATTVVNMSEFQDKHTISRLIGSPPGYVGYGEGGVLTEAVRQRPYSVVLLDEVEKGHLDVLNLFYQVFDKGVLADGEGREIDFSNTVIFLTSNLATDQITELTKEEQQPSQDKVLEVIRPLLSGHFKPALLARMNIVPYFALSAQALKGIVERKLARLSQNFYRTNRADLVFDESVVTAIAMRCTEVETGARNVDLILRKHVLPVLAERVLLSMTETPPIISWKVRLVDLDQWVFEIEGVRYESV